MKRLHQLLKETSPSHILRKRIHQINNKKYRDNDILCNVSIVQKNKKKWQKKYILT